MQPDKVGAMGYAWAQLYEFDGNAAYRDAAIDSADALASHVRTGNSTQSPWPFRVNAATGAVREQYSANVIDPIQLFDALIEMGIGNTEAYRSARRTAWDWLMAYPMRNNNWSNYFEDVPVKTDLSNTNQLIPMMTARYLLTHPETDPNWRTHVEGLISWVDNNFGVTDSGATTIREQDAFFYPMGSHTSRYASVNALYSQITGNTSAKTEAYYSLNWSTYMARRNGVVIDGPQVNNQWFTDGYGDYIRHFLTSMQAFPEWAPSGQTHLTGSTSLVRNITYAAGAVSYTTADPAATDSLRLNFAPQSVVVDGPDVDQEFRPRPGGLDLRFRNRGDANPARLRNGGSGPLRHQRAGEFTAERVFDRPGERHVLPGRLRHHVVGCSCRIRMAPSAPCSSSTGTPCLSTSTSSPYSYTWRTVGAGTFVLTAVATDNTGATSRSSSVHRHRHRAGPRPARSRGKAVTSGRSGCPDPRLASTVRTRSAPAVWTSGIRRTLFIFCTRS